MPCWNSNQARRHVGIVTVQPDYSLKGVLRANLERLIYKVFRYIEEELTWNVRLQGTMDNLKAEFHEHLTCPRDVTKNDEEMNICLLESHLSMSKLKSHANLW